MIEIENNLGAAVANAFVIVLLVFLFLRRIYQMVRILNKHEQMQGWTKAEGTLEGSLVIGQAKPGRFYFLRSFLRKIFRGEQYVVRVSYTVADTKIVCDQYNLLQGITAKDRLEIRNIVREPDAPVSVYYNPNDVSEATIKPPSNYRLAGQIFRSCSFLIIVLLCLIVVVI